MTETWYKVRKFFDDLTPVEVARSTDKSIWIGKNRRTIDGDFDRYFSTWDDAHAFLLAKVERQLDQHRLQLQRLQGLVGNIKGMKPPLPITQA